MARLIITIPDEIQERVYAGVATAYSYLEAIPNPDYDSMYPPTVEKPQYLPNPESRDDFVKRQVRLFLCRTMEKAEVNAARDTAAAGVPHF